MNYYKDDYIIHYEKYGKANNNIIILPGWGETKNTFKYMIDTLKKSHTIYLIDYPGFGDSPFPSHNLILEDYTDIIYNFIKDLKIKKPTIIAHSFGGRITIDLFTRYKPNINKVILIDIAGIKPKKTMKQKFRQRIYKILKKLGNIFPNKIKQKYLEKLISIFGSNDLKNLNPNFRNTFISIVNKDQKNDIKNIDKETLIIWGEDDIDTPIKDAYFINKEIKDSGLIILNKTGHFSYFEKAYYVNQVIDFYLKK